MNNEIDLRAGDVRMVDEVVASADDLLFCADLTWLIRQSQSVKNDSKKVWSVDPVGKNEVALRFQSGCKVEIKFDSPVHLLEQIIKILDRETANA